MLKIGENFENLERREKTTNLESGMKDDDHRFWRKNEGFYNDLCVFSCQGSDVWRIWKVEMSSCLIIKMERASSNGLFIYSKAHQKSFQYLLTRGALTMVSQSSFFYCSSFKFLDLTMVTLYHQLYFLCNILFSFV